MQPKLHIISRVIKLRVVFTLAHTHTHKLPEKDITSVIMRGGGKGTCFHNRQMQIVNVQRGLVTLVGVMKLSYYCKLSFDYLEVRSEISEAVH